MKKRGLLGLCAVALVALAGPALAADDVAQGKAAFAKCAICHQVGPNAKTLVGPELNGIVGRKAGSVAGYNYSPGMKELGEKDYVWTEENLDKWITDPKALLPTSPMALAYQGIKNADERAHIISYLKTFPE
ncbi:MAG: cytochrome c family protein [Alphaproteobacteria bacterium]|nr:cytochrome c family protein [Alphaproteobacteria bacterium]